jgi:hypothetical protein
MKLFADRDWTIIFWTYFAVACMVITAMMFIQLYEQQGHTMRAVYAICNESRLVADGRMEQACGDAQSASGTEFLCSYNNRDPNTHCWVELK